MLKNKYKSSKEGAKLESIVIPSTKSLTLTNKIPDGNINGNKITVGTDGLYTYSSLLFFDISIIPSNAEISNAELVLFKTDNFYKDNKKCIYIYPLFDYFSTYTTYENPPEVNHIIRGSLFPLTSKISVTANLTKIVSLWLRNATSNKGIILCKKNNFITSFGSALCNDKYLTPFIKVIYNIKSTCIIQEKCTSMKVIYYPCPCNPCPPTPTIRSVEVTGTVSPYSIYVIIVTLTVIRSVTGHIDKYYVTDEYDNSASNSPLAIDKFYSIAVIPQENPGDTEQIDLSGSYKG